MHERLKWLPRSGERGPCAVLLGRDGADNLARARSERSRPRLFCGGSPCAAAAPMRSAHPPPASSPPGLRMRQACQAWSIPRGSRGCRLRQEPEGRRSLLHPSHSTDKVPTRARPRRWPLRTPPGWGSPAAPHLGAIAIAKSAHPESVTGTRTACGTDRIVRARAPALRPSRTRALRCGFVVSQLRVAVPWAARRGLAVSPAYHTAITNWADPPRPAGPDLRFHARAGLA